MGLGYFVLIQNFCSIFFVGSNSRHFSSFCIDTWISRAHATTGLIMLLYIINFHDLFSALEITTLSRGNDICYQ